MRQLKGSRTDENLRAALEREGCERHPALAAVARDERLLGAAEWFDLTAQARPARVARLVRALDSPEDSE